jgi:replicative DNA helicase
MKKRSHEKFQFDTEFQEAILRYMVTDRNGHKAIPFVHDQQFSLLEHQIICKAVLHYYRVKKKLPQEKIYLNRELDRLFNSREYSRFFANDNDKLAVKKLSNKLYSRSVKDPDELLQEIAKFKAFCRMQEAIDDFNVNDFTAYEKFSREVQKAINIENTAKPDVGILLIEGLAQRQSDRKITQETYPTPFRQLNRLFNSGVGHDRGNVMVVLAPEKSFKTGFFVNLAKGYLKRKKKILFIDLENGQNTLAIRFEQSVAQENKAEILSGKADEKLKKLFRKYRRLGAEIEIKRFPAYATTVLDIENYCAKRRRETGMIYDLAIIDYPSLMNDIDGSKDDNLRIQNVYMELKNLAERMDWEVIWGAAHVTREGRKRLPYKYEPNDTAKCIDINRNVDLMVGLNQNDEEREAGVMRLELIQQRDGVESGTCMFWVNKGHQYMKEFTHQELSDYNSQASEETKPATNPRKLNEDV